MLKFFYNFLKALGCLIFDLVKANFLSWREINCAHKFFEILKLQAEESSKPTPTEVYSKKEDDSQVMHGREENAEDK